MSDEAVRERLRRKAEGGAANVLEGLLEDKRVQKTLRKFMVRETVKQGLILSALLVGALKMFDVARATLNWGLVGDLVMGIVLFSTALTFILKGLKT